MNRSEILDTAKEYVMQDRAATHGNMENNFNTIAEYWSIYCDHEYEFSAHDVAVMMSLVKIARIGGNHGNVDSWVDIAGYAACGGECACK